MKPTHFEKLSLGLSGSTALIIGVCILFVPHAFYAGYGITLAPDASRMSELRAPGAGLAVSGMVMMFGLLRQSMLPVSAVLALTVFSGFPLGRLVSLVTDGVPSTGILGAFAFEVCVAVLCLMAFAKRLWQPASAGRGVQPVH